MRRAKAMLLLVLLLAGCFGGDDSPRTATSPPFSVEVHATPTTGIVRGVVVDHAVRPLQGVDIVLDTGALTQTNEHGAFGLDDLAPGEHVLTAAKPGFLPVTTVALVAAGVDEPPLVRLQLLPDAEAVAPYVDALKADGFILCTTTKLALCHAANVCPPPTGCLNLTSERTIFRMSIDPGPAWVQSEWVWDATTPSNERIRFQMASELYADRPGCEGSWVNQTAALPSPTYATVSGDLIGGLRPGSTSCTVQYGAQSAPMNDLLCVDPSDGLTCPGATTQQAFTVFLHSFYGYVPPAGWRFSEHGAAAPPR